VSTEEGLHVSELFLKEGIKLFFEDGSILYRITVGKNSVQEIIIMNYLDNLIFSIKVEDGSEMTYMVPMENVSHWVERR
jgi:hypothetical protein